jgi:hypothetical protein
MHESQVSVLPDIPPDLRERQRTAEPLVLGILLPAPFALFGERAWSAPTGSADARTTEASDNAAASFVHRAPGYSPRRQLPSATNIDPASWPADTDRRNTS